jgi:hypothetical protein
MDPACVFDFPSSDDDSRTSFHDESNDELRRARDKLRLLEQVQRDFHHAHTLRSGSSGVTSRRHEDPDPARSTPVRDGQSASIDRREGSVDDPLTAGW